MFISKEEKLKLRMDIVRLREDLTYTRNVLVEHNNELRGLQTHLRMLGDQYAALQRDVQHRYGTKKDGSPKARPGGPKKDAASPLNAIAEGASA